MTPEEKAKALALAKAKLRLLQLQQQTTATPEGMALESPLAQAIAAAPTADTFTIQTPTGPITVDKEGNEVVPVTQKMGDYLRRTAAQRLGEGVAMLSGTTGGQFAPQLLGLEAARQELVNRATGGGSGQGLGDIYRGKRDATQADVNRAVEQYSPKVLGLPVLPMAGAVLSAGPAGETAGARMGLAAALSALHGAQSGPSDLSRGDVGGVLQDAAQSGVLGLATAGLGEGLGAPLRWLSGKAGAGARKAVEEGTRQAGKPIDKAVAALEEQLASAGGKVGAEAQKGSRLLENVQRGAGGLTPAGTGPAAVGPELQREATLALSSPEARSLAEGVLQHNLETLPGQLESLAARKAQAEALKAAKPSLLRALEARRGELVKDYFSKPLAPLATWARSQLPRQAFGATVGGGLFGLGELTDNDALKAAGGAAYGGIAAAPGVYRAWQNLSRSPAARAALLPLVERALSSPAGAVSRAAVGANQGDALFEALKAIFAKEQPQ